MSWLCTKHKPLDIRLEHRALFPLSFFHFSFLNHSSPISVFLSCSASFSRFNSLPTSPSLSFSSETGDPGPLSQEPVRWVVQTTGKMFHFFFLLLHLSNSPLHLSIRVWDCRTPLDCASGRFSTQMTGIACPLKNYASVLLWFFVNLLDHRVKFPISHPTNFNFSGFLSRSVFMMPTS